MTELEDSESERCANQDYLAVDVHSCIVIVLDQTKEGPASPNPVSYSGLLLYAPRKLPKQGEEAAALLLY